MNDDILFYAAMAFFYGLAAYNCVRVLSIRYTAGATIAWIVTMLSFPAIGVLAYYLFGDSRIRGYVRRHRQRTREISGEDSVFRFPPPPAPSEVDCGIRKTYSEFLHVFGSFGTLYEPSESRVELLIDGDRTFRAIFESIATARHYICVQYYILRSDRLGLELKRLLMEKAKSGVPVYLLYDDMGSFWLSRQYIKDLKRCGVATARFLPVTSFKRFFQLNFRNHRKLVIVDGLHAFTGGLNVGEEYAARRSSKRPGRYWRDTHLYLSGPSVRRLEETFYEDWYFATGEKLDALHPAPLPFPAKPLSGDKPEADVLSRPSPSTRTELVQIISTGPTDPTVLGLVFLLQMIRVAQKRLWIATPYFVPDPSLAHALELAVLRGVDVRLLLPQVSDSRFVHWVSLSYAEQMQAKGVKVLLYEAGFMHQKVILVDDGLSAVGTMNIDNRAIYLNFETMAVVHGKGFASQLAEMLRQDFLGCRYFQPDTRKIMRALIKLRGNLARLAAPLL